MCASEPWPSTHISTKSPIFITVTSRYLRLYETWGWNEENTRWAQRDSIYGAHVISLFCVSLFPPETYARYFTLIHIQLAITNSGTRQCFCPLTLMMRGITRGSAQRVCLCVTLSQFDITFRHTRISDDCLWGALTRISWLKFTSRVI